MPAAGRHVHLRRGRRPRRTPDATADGDKTATAAPAKNAPAPTTGFPERRTKTVDRPQTGIRRLARVLDEGGMTEHRELPGDPV
ncbi:hypothetical protein GCM10010140_61390 [Streptosporangium pseudovulgare]|uniref:Uncharacterized protein n=1 Tax=Streptosporangium pseudovulgare TaxID=35765 RepID=A0ABQ2RAZ1_9ACTN|nr:hypothetical protein GCM10010140_61390 [Streptosporangium pseudovulgare]